MSEQQPQTEQAPQAPEKVKIRILRNFAIPGRSFEKDQTVELDPATAQRFIDQKNAEPD